MFVFYAENCADELWLMWLENALENQQAIRMTIELEDGTEVNLIGSAERKNEGD